MRVEYWVYRIPLRLRSLLHRADAERELDEELLFHFEQLVAQETARGRTPEEARCAARRRLGNLAAVQEEARETWGWNLLGQIWRDLRYGVRILRKSPWVTAAAVLSLALGIGANTAIFTLIESTLLRPIALKHPERLRLLTWRETRGGWVPPGLGYTSPTFGTIYEQQETPDGGLMHTDFTPDLYSSFKREDSFFDSVFAFKELGRVTAAVEGNAEPVNCFLVSGDFYRGLEVSPVIGRAIGPKDGLRTAEGSVALISYEYWTRRFHRSPSVIGKTIDLNGFPVTIIGVNPEYFTGIEPGANFEIWAPLHLSPIVYGELQASGVTTTSSAISFLDNDKAWVLPMMGRLKPGVSDTQAQSALDVIFQRAVDANPGPAGSRLQVPAERPKFLLQSASRGVDYLTERYDRIFLTVLLLAAMVLLIACANVANLLLAKSAGRQREISVRLAIGASRWRIAGQLLVEGLLLAAMAGVVGVVLGYCTRNGIPALLSTPWRSNPFDTTFDPRVLLATIAITFLTGVLFSLAPMWQSRRVEMNEALKEASRSTAGLSNLRLGRLLAMLQIALSIVLLVGAGLCARTFTNLRDKPLGFQPKGVLVSSFDLPRLNYPPERIRALLMKLQQRLTDIRGVESASFSLSSGGIAIWLGDREGALSNASYAGSLGIGSGFFGTMGIRILYGRAIDEHDQPGGPLVAVVNQEFARRFFHGEDPLGKTFTNSVGRKTYRIVGVCADWILDPLRGVYPAFYRALIQEPNAGNIDVQVKSAAGDEALVVGKIREALRSIDSNLIVVDVHTEAEQIENTLAPQRFMASLAEIFGALALFLASIGIYGVMAYGAARRTNEIGIRMALGAKPGGVQWILLRETLMLTAAGLAIGIPAVSSLSRVLDYFLGGGFGKQYLYGIKPNDPLVIAAATMTLVAMTLFAGYLPARRAARIDPMAALRHD